MNILVIAPHPDDEALGCGGTLCLHEERGDSISIVFMTSGELGLKHLLPEQARAIREQEARKAAEILGVSALTFLRCGDWMLDGQIAEAAALLAPVLASARPDLIYAPHSQDSHPDHKATLPILSTALQKSPISPLSVRCYEIWTPLQEYTRVENISHVMDRKLKAVRAHESQVAGCQQFDYLRAITGLNQYRGAMAGKCDYAEVFLEITL